MTPTFEPPETVLHIAKTLIDAGYETWCVGGAVRDAILGIPNQDWDIATAAPPDQTRKLFRRTVPLGIEFGTVGVIDRHEKMHEVTTFRRDVQHDGRHAIVEFGASFEEDLKRRDFTINAIAYDPFTRRVFDPFGGRADLRRRVVRAVGIALERFIEDRLRVLRGIRFAARFGFAIEEHTWQAMVQSAPHLRRLSAERVKQELDKTLEQALRPSVAFVLWQRAGVFANLIPALNEIETDVLRAVDTQPRPFATTNAPRKQFRRMMRLATLFSDCSPAETTKALRALRAPNAETSYVASLIDRWRSLREPVMTAVTSGVHVHDATLREWAATIGRTRIRAFARLVWARLTAQTAESGHDATFALRSNNLDTYKRLLQVMLRDPIELADLAIDGDDLRRAGVPDGPALGTILRETLAFVVADPSQNTRDTLLAFAIRRHAEIKDRAGGESGRN